MSSPSRDTPSSLAPLLAQSSVSTSSIFNTPGSTPATPTSNTSGARVTHHSTLGSRRLNNYSTSSASAGISGAEDTAVKEVDDVTTTPSGSYEKIPTASSTLSRLFAPVTPQMSYGRDGRSNSYRGSDAVKLEEFLYTRGFREGACSDIAILAFGARYPLHRLILDRSPFFSSCFNGGNGGPWLESNSSEINLSPEISDPNISQHAFELALARLYGHVDRAEEDKNALPLLAAASYLELQDLAESCVASLLRNLKTANISKIIRFVTNSYYGATTDRLLESCKALLYRDGWEMDFREWDGISGEIAAEIAGYEGFYVPSEYSRYCFVRDLIDWRIRHTYQFPDSPLEESHKESRRSSLLQDDDDGTSISAEDDMDVKPLRDLLEEGIYYVHMPFEELQKIKEDRDVLGRPSVREDIINAALWQQIMLRQKVMTARQDSPELGVTKMEQKKRTSEHKVSERTSTPTKHGKESQSSQSSDLLDSFPSLGGQAKKKFYIPTEDSTTVIGDCPEQPPQVIVSQRGVRGGNSSSTAATTLAEAASLAESPSKTTSLNAADSATEESRYSDFPPFRFSAEFRSVRTLKEKKRVYSKTVFYAGSYWNIYIQKVKSSKNTQLGVYLHRAKDKDGSGSSSSRDFDTMVSQIYPNADDPHRGEGADEAAEDSPSPSTPSRLANTSRPLAAAVAGASATAAATGEAGAPVLGHYVDSRPMIQTYFKIFSPSRKGKMLSMFSSGPDSFNFSQSWGWKSSSLILEEGGLGGAAGVAEGKEERLRFMVVLGNV